MSPPATSRALDSTGPPTIPWVAVACDVATNRRTRGLVSEPDPRRVKQLLAGEEIWNDAERWRPNAS